MDSNYQRGLDVILVGGVMKTLQKLRANLESTQEPDPLLADCFREIESLRQQREALQEDLNRISEELGLPEGIGPASGEINRILSDLRQQLSDSQKREVMLREVVEFANARIGFSSTEAYKTWTEKVEAVLKATEPKE